MKDVNRPGNRSMKGGTEPNRHTGEVKVLLHSAGFQRWLAFALAVVAVFFCVSRGTMPKRYRLSVGERSSVDIIAPRDIVNALRTEQTAEEKAAELPAVVIENAQSGIAVANHAHDLIDLLSDTARAVRDELAREATSAAAGNPADSANALDAAGVGSAAAAGVASSGGAAAADGNDSAAAGSAPASAGTANASGSGEAAVGTETPAAAASAGVAGGTNGTMAERFVRLGDERIRSLIAGLSEESLLALATDEGDRLEALKTQLTEVLIPDFTSRQVTEDSLPEVRALMQSRLASTFPEDPWRSVGQALLAGILEPNARVDEAATESQRQAFILAYVKESPVVIYKDERILNRDDVVTEDIWQVLRELNYIEQEGGTDYALHAAVLLLVLALAFSGLLLMRRFAARVTRDAHMVSLICTCVVIGSFMVWMVKEFLPGYAAYLMPVSVVPVLLATLVGIESAVIVNIVLTLCYAVMLGGNVTFLLTSFISGTVAAFLSWNASQRRRISMAGVAIGLSNVCIVVLTGLVGQKGIETLINEGGLSLLNGLVSMVVAIGLLPFFETTFNVITPFKLQELADPNHPLLKRLLIEAPGTWHHSLMVGNLAESGTRAIGGNALLSRVGAYFHDVGKLKRPNFFKENQMLNENPHERLTASLSTLIITSHPKDGDELAAKYRLPRPIRDIILQHHGQTLVAYFYHKAVNQEKNGDVRMEAFRYEGPKPDTREAAVVLLADSVEAAVRSMQERTKGKTEGMVRKIIKDKLDDGQLDRCDLSFRDLGLIADSFMQVLGGIFHERPEYPELERKNPAADLDSRIYSLPVREPVREPVRDPADEPAEGSGAKPGGVG